MCDIIIKYIEVKKEGHRMDYIKTMILGLVQGLTEFLPVSSSGHLAIFKEILGADALKASLTMDILLHVGTLMAVFLVYYKDIWMLIREFFAMVWDLLRGKPDFSAPYRRFVIMVVVGSIPAAVVGILLKDFISELPLLYVGIALFVTAALLYLSDRLPKGKKDMATASYPSALLVGLFQGFAILPGISRSGSTIVGATVAGYTRAFAVKFSFILSIPAILGAAVLDLAEVLSTGGFNIPWGEALLGMAVAAISGFIAIRWLIKLVQNSKFHYFSYYCILAGIGAIILYFI